MATVAWFCLAASFRPFLIIIIPKKKKSDEDSLASATSRSGTRMQSDASDGSSVQADIADDVSVASLAFPLCF